MRSVIPMVTLVAGGDAEAREAAIARHTADLLAGGDKCAAILEGMPSRPAHFDPAVQLIRIAPGCPCCTGNLGSGQQEAAAALSVGHRKGLGWMLGAALIGLWRYRAQMNGCRPIGEIAAAAISAIVTPRADMAIPPPICDLRSH